MKQCEKCGARPKGEYGLLSYCLHCSKDLCPKCMEKGCCKKVPAIDGETGEPWKPSEEDTEAGP